MSILLAQQTGAEPMPFTEIGTDPIYSSHGISNGMQIGLGAFFLMALLMNLAFLYCEFKSTSHEKHLKTSWLLVFIFFIAAFLIQSAAFMSLQGWVLSPSIRHLVDWFIGPVTYFLTMTVGFCLFIYFRKIVTEPIVAWTILNISFLAGGWAMTDPNFASIIAKEDNVPIVLLIYSVGFFTWLGMRKAVVNDERIANGEPPLEKLGDEKVLVWPDLVYTELICMVIATFALVIWAVVLKAPLEQPATSAKAPNPSKAPWYFLGLQEMLVYYDPWMAGVVLPTMIVVGLIAMPYIDYNQKGNGYYTFNQRKFAITTWLFGFVVLWVVLIVLGTFLRGPNWNFFGPFEYWDPHKVVPLNNINLSDMFWLGLMGTVFEEGKGWFVRELPGIILVAIYMIALPPVLAKTVMRSFYIKMGFIRFFTLVTLIQFMAALPIKMVLRWTLNLKYIVYIPEYFVNI